MGIKNLSYFSIRVFIMRLTYDFLVMLVILLGYYASFIDFVDCMTFILPLTFINLLIVFLNVIPGSKQSRKLYFRMVKT